jgi:hypothetical protein
LDPSSELQWMFMSSLLRLLLWRADESESDRFDLEFQVLIAHPGSPEVN